MTEIKFHALSESDLGRVPMLCGHSPTYRQGYDAKVEWMRARLGEGMRYTLAQVNGWNAGMIEYLPAEYAWRGVQAPGYLFIHCLWVVGRNRKHGYGGLLLDGCLQESGGTNGVVVMSTRTHWLPTQKIFLKNGFELADEEPPFELLVKRNKADAPLPRFLRSTPVIPPGLSLYYSDQCPYMQNMPAILTRAGEKLGIAVNLFHLKDATQARQSPHPYGVMSLYHDGKFLEYRPIGTDDLLEKVKLRLEKPL